MSLRLKRLSHFASVLIAGLVFVILLGRLHVGLVRFFDPDETAHANWIYLSSQWYVPYRDFFYYYTPFYHWLLAPVFWFPEGPYLIILLRFIAWGTYVALVSTIYALAYKASKTHLTALLSCFIFVIFPMTFDKTIEIRPDMLMMLFFFIGVYLLFETERIHPKRFFTARNMR